MSQRVKEDPSILCYSEFRALSARQTELYSDHSRFLGNHSILNRHDL